MTEKKDESTVPPVRVDAEGKKHYSLGAKTGKYEATGGVAEAWIKPPPDHPVYAKLGRITSDWSHVEKALDETIWRLVDKHDRKLVACLTGQYNGTYPRHNAILALIKARGIPVSDKLVGRIDEHSGACNRTSSKRNRFVHDALQMNVEDSSRIAAHRSWPKEDRRFGVTPVTDDEFEKVIKSIDKRLQEWLLIHNELIQLGA